MRKLFFSIILMMFGLSAFAQPQTKYAHFIPAYPPVVGESTYNNLVFTHNGLYLHDIILDSLPHYEIEQIPNQTVRFLEDGIGFYVKADSLHSNQVVYSYSVDNPPIGPFEFNANTGRFKFYPNTGDYRTFHVTFTATAGLNSLSQTVEFDIMPEVVPEEYAIQNLGEMPSAQNYTILAESHTQMFLNNTTRTVYSYSVSGKDVVFDNNLQNKVWGLSGQENIYELNIFAERLYIRSALAFPHTNVNIYARELIFEDNGSEIASINTTPSAIIPITNETGMNGEDAGNITLHVNKLTANYAKRFILNGAKGQSTNLNGTPGNGGNGGVLSAPINIEGYGDFARGSAGVRYDTLNSVIGAGQAGINGHFERITDQYSWMHPYYIAAVVRHINDSYLNNYFSYSKTTANDYYNLINEFEASDEWDDFDGTLKVELQDQRTELEGLLYKLNENLDFFGNPLGWAPMLSFEVLLSNYNNEIDRAIPTLYLNYWLQHIDQTLESWVTASQEAASQTQNDIVAAQGQINSLTNEIPVLENKINVLQGQIEETQNRLEQLKAKLMAKAKHNVKKRNRLKKAFGICKAVANCIPVYGPAINTGLSVAGNYFGISDTYGYESALTSAYQSFTNFDYGAALGTLRQAINGIDLSHLGQTGHQLKDSYQQLESAIKPVYNSIASLHETFAKSSAPNDQVQAEFDKLCSQSAEFQNFKAEIEALQQSYAEFAAVLTQTFVDIVNLTSEVSNDMVTLDALRNDVFQGNSKRDLQAMQCVEKMRQRAMNRLVKYHYYMRKAYEYRLLSPYQGDFSLESMYNRLEAMIDQGQVIFDNSTPASPTAYSVLAALFREEVSVVIEDVIDDLVYNAPEQTTSISLVIPKEVLDKINANEEYNLDLYNLGVLSPDEENIRITGFDVQYMEAHTEGNTGMSTYMDIDLVHSGISRFRKDGEVYWFNHISRKTQNPHPNTWKIRYNPTNQETTAIGPSLATQSLLYSLLNGNAQNIMLFSRPAAWSDIFMSKKVHSSGNADIVIDSLVLSLQYDFTPRPDAIRNIDITTSDGLLAYITCSEADRNGRSNGKGSFHRSYTRGGGTVTFTAEETYGNYHFLNWTNRAGNVVSETAELIINKMTDQFYRANYELWIPVISVADTIFVGSGGGEYEVQIRNVGLGDIEMDWYVSDSLSTWVHLNGVAEGIDDGYFTFSYEPFSNQGTRIDSLEILAPEIEGMSKMIYIVQKEFLWEVSVDINPDGAGEVIGTGFYQDGANCTLTASANENYAFVNWTENDSIVFTDATCHFTVTADRNLVANFTSTANHWTPEDTNYSDNMGLTGIIQINGVEQRTETLEVGVFCGNECRGSNTLSYFQPTDRYIVMLTIYGNTGDNLSFKLYDHVTEQELDLTSPEDVTFNVDGYGTPVAPYALDFFNTITHTRALVSGWNWYSTYIELNGINGLTMLENSLGDAGIRIQGRNGYVEQFEYQGIKTWYGTLNGINNEQMYKVRTNVACNVEMIGDVASVANHPITINRGWNWIGFPVNHSVSVTSALSGFVPEADDIIKGRNGYSTFIVYGTTTMWYGTLNNLEPGQGYMYKSNSNTAKTLTFQIDRGEDKLANNTFENNVFIHSNARFADNMTVTAVIDMDGEELRSENYELAAFVGDECRGNVRLMYVEPFDRYVAFLTIFGEGNEDVRFALTNGSETKWSEDQLLYVSDATIGALSKPATIHFGAWNVNEDKQIHAVVYPNPSKNVFNIQCAGIRKIEVVNIYGQVIISKEIEGNFLQVDLSNYAAGTYMLHVITDKGVISKQLIKK
ncbi:MAG: T9SS type A sorting domain-containing protein [Bacteroidales bacterium]|nr:T9SS type A sorting domain-containing protein [Bacteroidales bacterium]